MRTLLLGCLLLPSAGGALQSIVVSTTAISVTEGSSGIVTVSLAEDPGPGVIVTVTPGVSSGGLSATLTPLQLDLTGGAMGNWSTGLPLTINVPEDADLLDGSATVTLFAVGLATRSVVVTLLDNDRPAGSPTASITLPQHGDVVSGIAEDFFGTATDNVAVVDVQFFVDGALISTQPGPAGPYHVNGAPSMWNTSAFSNGAHVLRMTASDGTLATSHEITVTVSNGVTGGGSSGGGGCGALGIESLVLLALLRRRR